MIGVHLSISAFQPDTQASGLCFSGHDLGAEVSQLLAHVGLLQRGLQRRHQAIGHGFGVALGRYMPCHTTTWKSFSRSRPGSAHWARGVRLLAVTP
jgi:hypothetical protein